jgi:predicted DNA-binding WGR domain protein
MRIYMQKPAAEHKAPRFYHLFLQQDLLEGWTLVKEWGTQGSPGRVTHEHFSTREAAERALLESRDGQINRGYRVVFLQGTYTL